MKRDFDPNKPELMDRPQPVTPELEADLENIRRLNQYFGGHSLVRHFLWLWLKPGRCHRILDLATGSADIPRMIADWARRRNIAVQIDAVDIHESTLEIARKRTADYPEISLIRADARTYCNTQTYDLVCCSLALHHFTGEDAVRLLRQMRRLSHDKVLVADLERGPLTSAAIWLLTGLFFREPMTRYDGRLSARRAFSFSEFRALGVEAGWENFCHRRFVPVRQAMWMCGREAQPALDCRLPAPNFAA